MLSSPEPPSTLSEPPRAKMRSSPPRPLIVSARAVPKRRSSPRVASIVAAMATAPPAHTPAVVASTTTRFFQRIRSSPVGGNSGPAVRLCKRYPHDAPIHSAVKMLRSVSVCLAVLIAFVVTADPASAATTRKKAMWGPATRDGVSQFPIYADLGVGIWQVQLRWSDVARRRPAHPRDPSDPAYAWPTGLDAAVGEATRRHIAVSLLVSGTPRWANGGRAPRWAPKSPRDFAGFVSAAARRYRAVRYWMIWGEPTKTENFQPLRSDQGHRLRGRGLRGPRTYAR